MKLILIVSFLVMLVLVTGCIVPDLPGPIGIPGL